MTKDVIESSVFNFLKLFSSGSFSVPWHQRKYDWKVENITELLNDIQESLNDRDKHYFLGSILLVEKSDVSWEVNDGQQRMVTISLMCAALCRVFLESKDCIDELEVCKEMLFVYDKTEYRLGDSGNFAALKPRLTPPDFDKNQYRMIIRGDDVSRNGKMTRAWRAILGFVEGLSVSTAKKLLHFVANDVLISRLVVREGINPNLVFEVINSRGKRLDDFDLIRNHIYSFFSLGYSEEERNVVHTRLEEMHSRLRDNSMGYAECFFRCEYGYLPKESFYKKVKAKIVEKETTKEYVYDLVAHRLTDESNSEIYRVMRTPSVNIDTPILREFHRAVGSPVARRNVSVLLSELQKYTGSYPVLFALLRAFMETKGAQERKKTAKAAFSHMQNLNAFIMRTAFVSEKFEPSRYAQVFSDLAKEIFRAKSIRNVDLINQLKEVDYAEVFVKKRFIEKISMVQFKSGDKLRPRAILMGLAKGELPIVNDKNMSVDHILPESEEYLPGWKSFDKATHAECRYMLGNLALLPLPVNRAHIKKYNRNFDAKKNAFRNSGIAWTTNVADCFNWTPQEIRKRQQNMAKKAANVWRFFDEKKQI